MAHFLKRMTAVRMLQADVSLSFRGYIVHKGNVNYLELRSSEFFGLCYEDSPSKEKEKYDESRVERFFCLFLIFI